jgi:hypothetical protein
MHTVALSPAGKRGQCPTNNLINFGQKNVWAKNNMGKTR